MSQPGDGDSDSDVGRHRFTFRSADSGADVDDDDLDDDAVSGDHEDDADIDDGTVVHGTVVHEDAADSDPVALDSDPVAFHSDPVAFDSDPVVADADDPQPTFTPVEDGPVDSGQDPSLPDPREPTLNETDDVPVVPAQATAPVNEAPATEAPLASAAAVDANAPLLGDPVGLRASWQQAQAGFVDDPRAAVADAAELVEHTAQTLIGALQQRQRQLRTQWENNGSGGPAAAGEVSDTEQLRHLMQDYRSLFNQLCRP
jgi:hypothetical protein